MGIDIALDELYATGWSQLDSSACEQAADGRWMPTLEAVRDEFAREGFGLLLTHIQLFDCYRAAWEGGGGQAGGAVVAQTEREAAVFALAQLRRAIRTAGAGV